MDRMSPSDGDDMGSTPVSNTILTNNLYQLVSAWGTKHVLNNKYRK